MNEHDLAAYMIFGIIMNFLMSMLFGLYLSKNIGMDAMMQTKGEKEQPWWVMAMLVIPYAKMLLTLYRVAILQLFFLNRGLTHEAYWRYLTHEEQE